MKIRPVTTEDYGQIEGDASDMPWLMAEQRFISFFSDELYAASLFTTLKKMHGCSTNNTEDWVIAMNSIIKILNDLPNKASETTVKLAFGIV